MQNRTYRFMKEEPLYPFGYGLSYTDFKYSDLALSDNTLSAGDDRSITVSASVENTGPRSGDEVVQLYVKDLEASITDRKSTRLNSSHVRISYAVFCLKKKKYESHRVSI